MDAGTGALWNFTWGRALIVQQEGRGTLRLAYYMKNEGYSLRVTEATGRTVESGYENDRLVYWVDPLGSKTELDWGKGLVKVRRDDGQLWLIGFDSEQKQTSLTFPDLSAWVWKRDEKGTLISQIDPTGRIINFETDDQGSLLATSSSLATISYHRVIVDTTNGRSNGFPDLFLTCMCVGGNTTFHYYINGEKTQCNHSI